MNLSKYVTLQECIKSKQAEALGIVNMPDEAQVTNLKDVCVNVFDKVREHFGKPIGISSGFRCQKLNERVGGSKTSQHVEGKALDIDGDIFGGLRNSEIFNYIKNHLEFDQLIWEFGTENDPDWVHVSFNKGHNRKMILRAVRTSKGTTYKPF